MQTALGNRKEKNPTERRSVMLHQISYRGLHKMVFLLKYWLLYHGQIEKSSATAYPSVRVNDLTSKQKNLP